jgi:hypothetical protein
LEFVPTNLYEKYGFLELSPFLGINHFESIGIVDPFPEIPKKKKGYPVVVPKNHED